MACASFLKFHPSISKKESENMPVGNPHENLLTREQKVLQRHSVEISNAGSYLNIRPSTLETLAKIGNCCVHNRKLRNRNADIFSSKDGEYPQPSALPPALRCLVYVWDQLCCNFIHLVETNSNDKENDFSSLKSNKSGEEKSSNVPKGPGQKKVEDGCWCELCDVFLPIPVTYHMRIVHPGCGKYAKGKGYNSIGVYCEGWAGNCGDGGQGVSSWYLMCEKCRQKYVNSAKVSNNVNYNGANPGGNKTEGGSNILIGFGAESTIPSELFTIMKENSFFLLELNSYNGGLINKSSNNAPDGAILQEQTGNRYKAMDLNDSYDSSYYFEDKNINWTGGVKRGSFKNLYESTSELLWPPPEMLSCLETLGAKNNSDLSYDLLGVNMADMHAFDFKVIEDVSMEVTESYIKNLQTSPAIPSTSKFHRSFSMGQGWNTPQNKLISEYNQHGKLENGTKNEATPSVVLRRKKQCTCTSGDSNLLNYPSLNLQKLVPEHLLSNSFSKESTPNSRSKNKVNSKINDKNNIQTNPRAALMANGKRPEDINFSEFLELYHNTSRESNEKAKNTDDKSDGSGSNGSNSAYKLDMQAGALSLLNRPSMTFMLEKHDLKKLRYSMTRNLRKTVCNIYSLQALNWLLRSVTQPIGLHDIMWWFISSLSYSTHESEDEPKFDEGVLGLEHPGSNQFNGPLSQTLSQSLHCLLQTIADLTLLLPSGSALQKTAVQCFGLKFKQSDHQFLHRSHVFGNISKILSKSEEQNDDNLAPSVAMLNSYSNAADGCQDESIRISLLNDITEIFDLIVSSRPALANSLIDNSTETFWESDEEDRNKPKIIELTMNRTNYQCKAICIHIDNSRDIGSKVSSILLYGGSSFGETSLLKTIDVDPLACCWITAPLPDEECTHYRLEFRGPEATLRVRQLKLLGYSVEDKAAQQKLNLKSTSANYIQQKNCEAETLRVFRLLTGQVFGKLILESGKCFGYNTPTSSKINESTVISSSTESLDLREHMVGILFSRSKLSHLQKQIIVHIVHAIQKEALRSREEWEHNVMFSADNETDFEENLKMNDTYCFEMLSMVLALSGSAVGRSYLSHQHGLLKDLFSLLHTGSDRVQRQVTALIRRILPEISPETLCELLGVEKVPETDFNLLSQNNETFNMNKCGILDIFLAVIAKALQVQIKVKNNSNKNPPSMKLWRYMNICKIDDYEKSTLNKISLTNSQISNTDPDRPMTTTVTTKAGSPVAEQYDFEVSSSDFLDDKTNDENSVDFDVAMKSKPGIRIEAAVKPRWFLNGTISSKQAENIMILIRDMAHGKLSDKWSMITKAAIAECILNITRLSDVYRVPETCMTTPTLWLALASLCVLDRDHVEKLSSSQWSKQSESRPLCSNHDDDVTYAMIICSLCGSLCSDCDRFLHLNRKTRNHYRTVCKEEEEAIRVELHESCGRAKLFWLLALVDSKTLKGMLEFRNGNNTLVCDPPNAIGVCRFCGVTGNTGLLAVGNVCVDQQCQEYAASACTKAHHCGHLCGGIINEEKCLPCLQQKCLTSESKANGKEPKLTQDADDMCMICFTEALSSAPSIQLDCGHVFHFHCCKAVLTRRWNGPRISFGFSQCPICKMDIQHSALGDILESIVSLKADVKRKALMRLEYEGVAKNLDSKDLAAYAMERYAYYVCSQCEKAYYGGEARCDAELGENYNPQELVCGGCSDVVKAKMCPKHGTDFLEYKCRYCCSVAVFFCFGTTHFCDTCHDDFQRLTNIPKNKLPKCPAGPKAKQLIGEECPLHVIHPPTGEEFALGCGICRNAHTF